MVGRLPEERRKATAALLKRIKPDTVSLPALAGLVGVGKSTMYRWFDGTDSVALPKLAALHAALSPSEDDMVKLVQLVQPQLEKEADIPYIRAKIKSGKIEHLANPALDADWFAQQPENMQAGLLLGVLREKNDLTPEKLAKLVRVNVTSIWNWESGSAIDYTKLEKLHKALSPKATTDEMVLLTRRAQPKLKDAQYESYIRKKINDAKVIYLAFPGLDREWLETQPDPNQARFLLEALREHQGWEQKDLGEIISESATVVSNMELGRTPVQNHREAVYIIFAKTLEEFGFSKDDFFSICERSAGKAEPSAPAETERKPRPPALDEQWLAEQPEALQAGLVLKSLREAKDLTPQALGELIDADPAAIEDWEKGGTIDYRKLVRLHEQLEPDKKHMFILTRNAQPRLQERKYDAYIRKQIKNENFDYLAFPALDHDWLTMQPDPNHAKLVLEALREQAGWSPKDLGKKIGESAAVISDMESDKINVETHKAKLKKAFKGQPHFGASYFDSVCTYSAFDASEIEEPEHPADPTPPDEGGGGDHTGRIQKRRTGRKRGKG